MLEAKRLNITERADVIFGGGGGGKKTPGGLEGGRGRGVGFFEKKPLFLKIIKRGN